MRLKRAIIITALLVLLLPGVALATDQGKSLKYGGGGLGTVIFDGRMHVGKGYVCKDCHDDLFMTKKQARVRMSDHFTDKQCFKCHDNKEAPRDCITCHRQVKSSGLTYSDYMRSFMAEPVSGEGERDELLTGRGGVSAQTRACLSCHSNPDLEAKTERGKNLTLFVGRPAYGVGAHGALPCAACHFGLEGEASFLKQPHALDRSAKVDCKSCHVERLAAEVAAFDDSAHMKKTEGRFSCVNCHNAHSQPQDGKQKIYSEAVAEYNSACLSCHANPEKYVEWTSTPFNPKGMEHSFMAKFEAHKNNVLCADCHSAMAPAGMGMNPHLILQKTQSLRDCSTCHRDMGSLIVNRVALRDGNTDALGGSYIPGNNNSGLADKAGAWAFIGIFAAIVLHGLARLMGKKKAHGRMLERVYVYPLPIRLFHWINALCFIILIWTGAGIHWEGLAFAPALEAATGMHTGSAWVLMANFAAFVAYGIISGDIRQYLPSGHGMASRLMAQLRYYLYGMFTGAEKPFAVTRERRFNPLQQISYLVVFILGMPVLILSGVLLLLPESATCGIAPRDTLAAAHYCLAIIYGLFLLVHLYLTTTGESVFSLMKSMFSGYHEANAKEKDS